MGNPVKVFVLVCGILTSSITALADSPVIRYSNLYIFDYPASKQVHILVEAQFFEEDGSPVACEAFHYKSTGKTIGELIDMDSGSDNGDDTIMKLATGDEDTLDLLGGEFKKISDFGKGFREAYQRGAESPCQEIHLNPTKAKFDQAVQPMEYVTPDILASWNPPAE